MLDDIVDKYNQKFHRTIKVKPMGVKSYAEYNVCSNVKHPKFKVGDHVRISKYKTFLLTDILQIVLKNWFLLAKLKI